MSIKSKKQIKKSSTRQFHTPKSVSVTYLKITEDYHSHPLKMMGLKDQGKGTKQARYTIYQKNDKKRKKDYGGK